MAAGVIRVLVVDDQNLVRQGLVAMLGLRPGLEVVGEAADGLEALELTARERPDVVLMDLRMPRCDGVEATRRIATDHPDVRVIVLTTFADDESVFSALAAGARGYLTKGAALDEIERAIEAVNAGEALMDPSVQRLLLDAVRQSGSARTILPQVPEDSTGPVPGTAGAGRLTPRETEVLRMIATGLSNEEIAVALFISGATVKTHVNNLFSKIEVRDRAQAVRWAFTNGLMG